MDMKIKMKNDDRVWSKDPFETTHKITYVQILLTNINIFSNYKLFWDPPHFNNFILLLTIEV